MCVDSSGINVYVLVVCLCICQQLSVGTRVVAISGGFGGGGGGANDYAAVACSNNNSRISSLLISRCFTRPRVRCFN